MTTLAIRGTASETLLALKMITTGLYRAREVEERENLRERALKTTVKRRRVARRQRPSESERQNGRQSTREMRREKEVNGSLSMVAKDKGVRTQVRQIQLRAMVNRLQRKRHRRRPRKDLVGN